MTDKPTQIKKPDLVELFDELKQENEKLAQLTDRTFYFVNQFKDCRQPAPEDCVKQSEPKGILENLRFEIQKIKKSNDILRQSVEGLGNIIGS